MLPPRCSWRRLTAHDVRPSAYDARLVLMSDWTGCSRATGICRRQHATKDQEIRYRQTKIEPLTCEMAVLKRWKFGRSREQLDAGQASLLDETIDADIAAIEEELEQLAHNAKADTPTRQQPKRAPLPSELPRVEHHHELGATTCVPHRAAAAPSSVVVRTSVRSWTIRRDCSR